MTYESTVQLATPTFTPHLQTNGRYHNNQLCFWPVFALASCRVHDNATSAADGDSRVVVVLQSWLLSYLAVEESMVFWHCLIWKNANDTETCPRPCHGLQKKDSSYLKSGLAYITSVQSSHVLLCRWCLHVNNCSAWGNTVSFDLFWPWSALLMTLCCFGGSLYPCGFIYCYVIKTLSSNDSNDKGPFMTWKNLKAAFWLEHFDSAF